MKKPQCIIILSVAVLLLFADYSCGPAGRERFADRDRLFNAGWKFIRDSISGAERPDFDDASWILVDLPHDWSMIPLPDGPDRIGPFSKDSPGATATGYVIGGSGWYRKHFTLGKGDAGKTVVIHFDGVYMESELWVNGKHVGNHVYGYTPFWFDITRFLNPPGQDNTIALRVLNTGRNSRWYSGSGIFRNVYLTVTDQVHIPVWGAHITTPAISDKTATVRISLSLDNTGAKDAGAVIKTRIKGPDNRTAGSATSKVSVDAKNSLTINQEIQINNPALWSVETPNLYRAEFLVEVTGNKTDRYVQAFGIRSVEVSAEKGFLLNGRALELKGGCMHHDNGLLGSAAIQRAEERRVELMKANGFNAIRTSHNPPSAAFLDACDRLGMLVIDEAFDMWERPKNPDDYHRFFREWWKKDLENMILRDRNHPSIIFWSIGNEINERADTSGLRIAGNLISFIHGYDTTRPLTNAICNFWDHPGTSWDITAEAFKLLDVGGYNYQWQQYEPDHEKYPQRIMMGTESVPREAFENWQQVKQHPWVIGDFVWTGMDYLGETGIGHTQYLEAGQDDVFAMIWPWFNAWCGDIDIIGDKKPQMLYRDVVWGNSPLEINVHAPSPEEKPEKEEKISYWGWPDEWPCWNWKGYEGKPLQVSVYANADEVFLELNGTVAGEKEISQATRLTAVFEIPYQQGVLKAVAMKNGSRVAEKTIQTTGSPAAIRLTADRNPIKADRNDLAFVSIEIVDDNGALVPDAIVPVKLTFSGNGEMAGSGNACPWDMESVGNTVVKTFRGKAMAILRPYAIPGIMILKAEANGLTVSTLEVRAK
jgi:beta-galactosidase